MTNGRYILFGRITDEVYENPYPETEAPVISRMLSDTANKVDAVVFGNSYTKKNSGGGSTSWHSVTPQGSVLGASRGPVGEIIDAVADSPVGQVLGATRKAVQTGDSSMMLVMGLGFVACGAAMFVWYSAWKKRKAEQ